nr:MAG TPA: hypothetical protein [Caudoviricetes sp.]
MAIWENWKYGVLCVYYGNIFLKKLVLCWIMLIFAGKYS